MSELLKPCPFCGQINEKVVDATRIFGVFNLIHSCRVVGFVELSHPSPDGVVELWNTRAAHPAVEVLDGLAEWLLEGEPVPSYFGKTDALKKLRELRAAKGV